MAEVGGRAPLFSGSASRARTCDPLINSQLLYQLSYRGKPRARLLRMPGRFVKPRRAGQRIKKRRENRSPAEALGDGGCLQKKTGSNSSRMVNGTLTACRNLPGRRSGSVCHALSRIHEGLEAPPGIEPGYKDLQSSASPLRHRASVCNLRRAGHAGGRRVGYQHGYAMASGLARRIAPGQASS